MQKINSKNFVADQAFNYHEIVGTFEDFDLY